MDMQRTQPPPTSVVMTTTEASNPPTPTSVFQHVIVQPGHLVQIPKTQSSREENSKNNGVLCKFMDFRIVIFTYVNYFNILFLNYFNIFLND